MSLKKSTLATAIGEHRNETFTIGESIFFRTVTYHGLGKITRVSHCGKDTFIHLEDASWIADTPGFNEFLSEGTLVLCEPIPNGYRVSVGALTDVMSWDHPLPNKVK